MSLASADLPADPESLRALAAALRAELAEKDLMLAVCDAEIHAKTLHIEKLWAELVALRRARFGRSSERLDRAIDQLELAIGELEEGEDEREVLKYVPTSFKVVRHLRPKLSCRACETIV